MRRRGKTNTLRLFYASWSLRRAVNYFAQRIDATPENNKNFTNFKRQNRNCVWLKTWAGGRGEQLRLPREDRWQRRSDGWTQQKRGRKESLDWKKKTHSPDAAINNTSRLNMADKTTHVFSDAPPLFSTCVSPAAAPQSDTSHSMIFSLTLTHTHTLRNLFSASIQHLWFQVWKLSRSAADRFLINISQAIGSEHQRPSIFYSIIFTVMGQEVV